MTATKRRPASGTIQAQILEQLKEVTGKVDESLKQGADNGRQIELIKLALGLDAQHGRLPELEKAWTRIDRAQENDHKEICTRVDGLEKEIVARMRALEKEHEARINALEDGEQRAQGRKQFWSVVWSLLSGGAAAAVFGYIAKATGLIH